MPLCPQLMSHSPVVAPQSHQHHAVVSPAAERGAGSSTTLPLHRALLSLLGCGALLLPAEVHHMAGKHPPSRHPLLVVWSAQCAVRVQCSV